MTMRHTSDRPETFHPARDAGLRLPDAYRRGALVRPRGPIPAGGDGR
ncbi:hypothetical protein [Streptomyces sp. NPDC053367]